ncbi:MAG TPA: hypothetical protein VN577_06580 [Terriglobales bacterium]|nr:hypothetical protein [Terriglobales bacterium]
MERIQYTTDAGVRILDIDCRNCSADEVAEIADKVPEAVLKEPEGSVLLLCDFRGSQFSRKSLERLKLATARDSRQIRRSAWIIDGNLPKPFHQALRSFSGRELRLFSERQEAIDFLVEEAKSQAS